MTMENFIMELGRLFGLGKDKSMVKALRLSLASINLKAFLYKEKNQAWEL